ncbi:unnamed protein product, partial [Closterium sp. NIES-53]
MCPGGPTLSVLPLCPVPTSRPQLSQQLGSSLASLPQLSAVQQDVAEHHVPRWLTLSYLSLCLPRPVPTSPLQFSQQLGSSLASLPQLSAVLQDVAEHHLSQHLGSSLASLPQLSAVLQDVAEHHVPRRLQQRGYFQLKPACWEEFDPLFPHYSLSELEEAQ